MNTFSTVAYFMVVTVTMGVILAFYFRFRNTVLGLESRLTGIWSNESNTIRILIYAIESRFQAEVVWTRNPDDRILGSGVIRDMSLKYFSWGEGTYIDPITKNQFSVKMKWKQSGLIHMHLSPKAQPAVSKVEAWKQVR